MSEERIPIDSAGAGADAERIKAAIDNVRALYEETRVKTSEFTYLVVPGRPRGATMRALRHLRGEPLSCYTREDGKWETVLRVEVAALLRELEVVSTELEQAFLWAQLMSQVESVTILDPKSASESFSASSSGSQSDPNPSRGIARPS